MVISGISSPGGPCIDGSNNKIYYGSRLGETVYRADLDGSNEEAFVKGYAISSCDVHNGYLYWITYKGGTFMRSDLVGENVTELISLLTSTDDDSSAPALRDFTIDPTTDEVLSVRKRGGVVLGWSR